jgi:hypothetical protein
MDTQTALVEAYLVVDKEETEMTESFRLHNRGLTGSTSTSMATLEASARDRKNQLEGVLLQLKKMVTHLSLVTDNEVTEEDILEE